MVVQPGRRELICDALDLDKQGKFDAALKLLDQAIALAPDDPMAHSRKGLTLKHKGSLAAAMKSFDKALSKDPDHGPALYNKACTLMLQGETEVALRTLARAVGQGPAFYGKHASGDVDFAAVESDPVFQRIISAPQPEAYKKAARAYVLDNKDFYNDTKLKAADFKAALDEALESLDIGLRSYLPDLKTPTKAMIGEIDISEFSYEKRLKVAPDDEGGFSVWSVN